MSGPDKAGFVHLTCDVGLEFQGVVLSAESPRTRMVQALEESDCPQEIERAKAGADIVLWREYMARFLATKPPRL